jgi:hypothetical protein
MPQKASNISSGSESAVKSERPKKAKTMARKAVAAVGVLKSRGMGWSALAKRLVEECMLYL